jgi:hypothetical protein
MFGWWIAQYYPRSEEPPPAPAQTFRKGANTLARASQEPIDLLESITAAEIASCVPFIKIEKIDKLGKAATDVRPLMYDLIQTPQFGSGQDSFGLDSDVFMERSLVSLLSLSVDFDQQYGISIHRQITLEFMVHHPAIVFDRASDNSWREIMMAGKAFTLEYGWKADPTIVKNPLFNGHGHITESGQVIKSTQLVMLVVSTYDIQVMQNGEVKVTIKASENGDLCLREMKFSDIFERTIGRNRVPVNLERDEKKRKLLEEEQKKQDKADDIENVKALRALMAKPNKNPVKGVGQYYLMGEILDQVIAPMVVASGKIWGYAGVDLLLGKFNKEAGNQSKKYFGDAMADKGIENFRIPVDVVNEALTNYTSHGRAVYLQNFISVIIKFMNDAGAWADPPPGKSVQKPHVLMKSETVQTDGGTRLLLVIQDTTVGAHPFGMYDNGQNRIALDKQSKSEIFTRLKNASVPILEFAKAGTLITDASFQLQPDALLQSIQVEGAYNDRKNRQQQTAMPDVESRKGQSSKGELLIPVSIVEGDIHMYGNFAMEVFGSFWIEFYGSKELSGMFHVRGKTDVLEAGTFRSTFKVISEGIDPLNTRKQLDAAEIQKVEDRKKDTLAKSKSKSQAGQHSRSKTNTPGPKSTGTVVPRGSR